MNSLWNSLQKATVLGAYGAIGGLFGSVVGQILLSTVLALSTALPDSSRSRQRVDVMFVLDVTASMSEEIAGVRRGIRSFVDTLRTADMDSEVGLIAFRDLEREEKPEVVSINGKLLTADIDAFSYVLSNLEAKGGGDEPESSVEALVLAAEQPFRSDAAKVLILITDAPPKSGGSAISTVDGARQLVKHKIAQLHLVVQEADLPAFSKLRAAIPGSTFSLAESAAERKNFQAMLSAIANHLVREIRIASPLDSRREFAANEFNLLAMRTAVWTSALATLVFLLLVIGQCRYLGLSVPRFGSTTLGMVGCAIAGLIAGALGALAAGTTSQILTLLPISIATALPVSSLGRGFGWGLLGGSLGFGMSYFVPNLSRIRSSLGGTIGGILAVLIFITIAPYVGDIIGLLIGGAVVGGMIGLTIAIIEAAFREAWLEISYGRETRIVSLGAEPISIGSDREKCTVYAHGVAPIALRFRIVERTIECDDVVVQHRETVIDGDQKSIGNAIVRVRTSRGKRTPITSKAAASPSEFHLNLSNGASIHLGLGMKLTSNDLPGLRTGTRDKNVAEVMANPNNPSVIGLKNLTQEPWKATVSSGVEKKVEPGRSIQLAHGTRINFGAISGFIG